MKNETEGVAPLILAVVVIVVAAGVSVGAYVVVKGGGGGGGGIGSATSSSFDVTIAGTGTYTFQAKDIGSNNLKVRVTGSAAGTDFIYIVNGATQTAWRDFGGTWTQEDFSTVWSTWETAFSGYQTELDSWMGGTYTSPDGTVTISNIQVNPSLDDSLFTH